MATLVVTDDVASGNAGTPLLWATMLHLLFGNAVIGLVEGLVVSRLLPAVRKRAVLVMIGANYFSAWTGFVVLESAKERWRPTIENVSNVLVVLAVAAWAATIWLEWPFVVACTPWKMRRPLRALGVSALVQTITYLPLFLWFHAASRATLLTETHLVPARTLKNQGAVDLYYIAAADGDVWRLRLGQERPERICRSGSGPSDADDRLFFAPEDSGRWSLMGVVGPSESRPKHGTQLVAGVEGRAASAGRPLDREEPGTWFNFGGGSDLRDSESQQWSYWSGFWPFEGLRMAGSFGARSRLALETPFAAWTIRNLSVLPGDQIVFQLGADQICLLDRPTMQIALLAKGRGPAVVLPGGR